MSNPWLDIALQPVEPQKQPLSVSGVSRLSGPLDTSVLRTGEMGAHQILITNRHRTSCKVKIIGSSSDPSLVYREPNPSSDTSWPRTVSVNGRKRKADPKPFSAKLEHIGSCAPGNSHNLTIRLEIQPTFEEEQVSDLEGSAICDIRCS